MMITNPEFTMLSTSIPCPALPYPEEGNVWDALWTLPRTPRSDHDSRARSQIRITPLPPPHLLLFPRATPHLTLDCLEQKFYKFG